MTCVAVVVVTYQGELCISKCLESLLSTRCALHVIVVDNASTDSTVIRVQAFELPVTLIRLPQNQGFGKANNVGISQALSAGAEHIFLLNQDAFVVGHAIDEMLEFMQHTPQVGVCSPIHCSPDTSSVDARTYRHYLAFGAQKCVSDALLGNIKTSYRIRGINAAAWFIRSEVLQRYGGFDPLFFMYGEDDDLLDRWQHHGVEFALLPGSTVVHQRLGDTAGPTKPPLWSKRVARVRSDFVVQFKRSVASGRPLWRTALRIGLVAPFAAVLVERRWLEFAASLRAIASVWQERARIRKHVEMSLNGKAPFLDL
jgi:GT2 family glycosyltransferase